MILTLECIWTEHCGMGWEESWRKDEEKRKKLDGSEKKFEGSNKKWTKKIWEKNFEGKNKIRNGPSGRLTTWLTGNGNVRNRICPSQGSSRPKKWCDFWGRSGKIEGLHKTFFPSICSKMPKSCDFFRPGFRLVWLPRLEWPPTLTATCSFLILLETWFWFTFFHSFNPLLPHFSTDPPDTCRNSYVHLHSADDQSPSAQFDILHRKVSHLWCSNRKILHFLWLTRNPNDISLVEAMDDYVHNDISLYILWFQIWLLCVEFFG